MSQDPFENEIRVKQRPTFLTVLCILTFIGSGYGIINSVFTYVKADSLSAMITDVNKEINDDLKKKDKTSEEAGFVGNVFNSMSRFSSPEILRKSAVMTLVVSIFCLIGALLMWRLRKTGFYLYTLGTIIGVVAPFYLFGNNFMTNFSAGMQGFIGVLFVIFYAMNLKSMNNASYTGEL